MKWLASSILVFLFGFIVWAVWLSEQEYVHHEPIFVLSIGTKWISTSNGFFKKSPTFRAPEARKWCMIGILKPRFDAYSYIKDFHCFKGFREYPQMKQKKR